MPADLHTILLDAVSPFDEGVAALKLRALRDPRGDLSRPNRTAAVLVPILDKPEPEVLLTVRSHHLPQHPGQVSFPGGAVDRSDRDRLDTISDYRVLPVVGLVRPSFVWRPDEREVAEVFTVPLELAVSHSEYSHEEIRRDGKTFTISSLQWQGHRIWGVTAAILLNLGSRMKNSGPVESTYS